MSGLNHPPAFMLYPADFSSDGIVEAMTTEEVGAYWLLLCKAWFESPVGSIPNDDLILSRWARMTPQKWARVRDMVLRPFTAIEGGRLIQKRLHTEYKKILENREKKSLAGIRGAEKRWNSIAIAQPSMCHSDANGQPMAKNSISTASSNSNNRPGGGRGGRWKKPGKVSLASTRLTMLWADAQALIAGVPDLSDETRVWILAAALRSTDQGDDPPLLFVRLIDDFVCGDTTLLEDYHSTASKRFREWKDAK